MVRGNLAALMLVQGDLAGAQAEAELAVRLSRESGDDNELSGALNTLGDILLQQGQLKRARTAVEESLRVGSAVGFALSVTEAHYLMASIEVSDAHLDLALAHLVSLRDLLAQTRLAVRIPMLILGAASWAAAAGEDSDRRLAYRWLRSLGGQEGIDTTLRDKARALLPRIPGPAHDDKADPAGLALDELEREVFAFLEERA